MKKYILPVFMCLLTLSCFGQSAAKCEGEVKIIVVNTNPSVSDEEITEDGGNISGGAGFRFTAQTSSDIGIIGITYIWNLFNESNESIQQGTNVNFNVTFIDAGHYRVDLIVRKEVDGNICKYVAAIENIIVSNFVLWAPNAFSPNEDGINDVFKVFYKSIAIDPNNNKLVFKCRIFNRRGNEIYSWDNPDEGWDGKYRGKYVPPGTYFYVIEATDPSGKKHVKKGDVNIYGGRR